MQKDVFIYGFIGTRSGEVSIQNVKAQLSPDATGYTVHIVSGGGDVFEGYGIYNILKNTGKTITVHIEGLCASIATLIAGAGSKIIMNRTSEFMIHNPKIGELSGDARTLRAVADQLDKIKTLLIDVYRSRTGLHNDKLWELYDNETWLTAAEAHKMGFVDEVQDAIKAVARIDNQNFQMEKQQETMFDLLSRKISNIFKAMRTTNQVTETLEDGRKVLVMAEGEAWEGVQVMLEDGTPLPAGEYKLSGGKTITVDENSVVTQVVVQDAPAAEDTKQKEEEEMENAKVKELEAKITQLEKEKAEASAKVQQAEARAMSFENSVKTLETQFKNVQDLLKKTAGDTTPPNGGGPNQVETPGALNYDPLAKFYKNAIRR